MDELKTTQAEIEVAQDALKDLRKQQREVEAKRKKAEEATMFYQAAMATFEATFSDREIYYVQELHRMFEYNRGWSEPWTFYLVEAFKNEHPLLKSVDGFDIFLQYLRKRNCYKLKATYSFRQQEPSMLNRLRQEHWLKPVNSPHNEYYDTLTWVLGGCNEAGRDHLEQILVHKYQHPEDFLTPTINWYGQGGTGKGFLMTILSVIAGPEQTAALLMENVTGSFNGMLKGKFAVLINEVSSRKADMNKLKNILGSKDFCVNDKNVPQYICDNTALYLIGSNDPFPLPMEGNDSERRWSPIRLTRSLKAVIAEKLDCTESEAQELWENNIGPILLEPTEIQKWLNHLIAKWGEYGRPEAYHGVDYKVNVAMRSDYNPVTVAVNILEQMTTWLPVMDLYCYVEDIEKFDRQKHFGSYNRFCNELLNEIDKKKLNVEYRTNQTHRTRLKFNSFSETAESRKTTGSIVTVKGYTGSVSTGHFNYSSMKDDERTAGEKRAEMLIACFNV